MSAGLVRVRVERYGVIRVLAVSGDLDLVTAAEFTQRASRAADDQAERFVLDLSGLRFIDCCGARALAAVIRAIPDGCPVIVRAVHPAASRVLELLGLDLERQPEAADPGPASWPDREQVRGEARPGGKGPASPAWQSQATWARSQHVMAETRMLAGVVAATEDQVAVTLARLAEQRPDRAERLRRLSEDARREAVHLRDRAQASGVRAARCADGGGRDAGADAIVGPLRARVTAGESGPVVVLTNETHMSAADRNRGRRAVASSALEGMASGETAPGTRDVTSVHETRNCEQCGTVFTPHREHARFCSSPCRDSWNRDHGGDLRTGASALDWTVTAMRNVTGWLATAGMQDRLQALEAVSEAVWWVTIVDATLNRHHLEACESVIQAQPVLERRLIEETLGGLRFVRNQMGYHVDHADFIEPRQSESGADDGPITAWSWKPLPEPTLAWLPPRGQAWEMARYRAYEAQLAGHSIGETFGRAAAFLKLASARATRSRDRGPQAAPMHGARP